MSVVGIEEAEEFDDSGSDHSGMVLREEAGDFSIATAMSSPCCTSVT